jgi:hypothetical protein
MLLIGSQALKLVRPDLLDREPVDWDLIGTLDEVNAFIKENRSKFKNVYPNQTGDKIIALGPGHIFEFELSWSGSSKALLGRYNAAPIHSVLGRPVNAADLNTLFLLKKSHRFLKDSPHFLKTMRDYRRMRDAGAEITDERLYKLRCDDTYTYTHPKLNVAKDEFFNGDGVTYIFDHDSIHESMKHLDRPAYTYFKPDNSPVLCSKKMFFEADEKTRLYSVLEESQVLALERSQIPHRGVWSHKKSFDTALMKVCTSITSGWWREYAYENYDKVQAMYEEDYVDRFWKAVDAGVVKKL